jgi:hypothetical protein
MFEVVFCVFACDTIPKYREEIIKIQETWGKLALEYPDRVKLLFFLGEQEGSLRGEQYIRLAGVGNDYLSASYKQFLGLKYIHDNYKAKFVFCCGTDTYVNIPLLLKYLSDYDHGENLYIGGHGCLSQIGSNQIYYHAGGGGFILSSKCLEKVSSHLVSATDAWGKMVSAAGRTDLIAACDVAIAYYVQLPEVMVTVVKAEHSVFMACNYKCRWYHAQVCIHHEELEWSKLVSCHFMSLEDFDDYTRILKLNEYFVCGI